MCLLCMRPHCINPLLKQLEQTKVALEVVVFVDDTNERKKLKKRSVWVVEENTAGFQLVR